MAYVLGQYNKNKNSNNDNLFMNYITEGEAKRRSAASDSGITGANDNPFSDECCYVSSKFKVSQKYYFHCKIKRELSEGMTFSVKLVNYEPTAENNIEQYIKTITVQSGSNDSAWADVELIFTPLSTFDTLLFELKRTVDDYKIKVRYPIIAYVELSEINNIIGSVIGKDQELIKIGVQSRPGLTMCINGEEIHTSRSGIYELKNGDIVTNFFSVVNGATENTTNVATFIAKRDAGDYDGKDIETTTVSDCFFASSKIRIIDSFTLDYVYKEKEEE